MTSRCMARAASAMGCVAVLLSACGGGEYSDKSIQICLGDREKLGELTEDLRVIAQYNGMVFSDRSVDTKREIEIINSNREKGALSTDPVINMGIYRSDGMAINVGNLGLPGYQVMLSFWVGKNPTEGRHFIDSVTKQLEEKWDVFHVPPGVGAAPLKSCRS